MRVATQNSARPGAGLARTGACVAPRAQGRRCKARDGPSTDSTTAERSREASAGRAQAWLARFASEAEHGRRERAKDRHGAASGARLAGPKAHASRVTRAVRSRIENGVRGARSSAHGTHRRRAWMHKCREGHGWPRAASARNVRRHEPGRARALRGAAQARAVTGRAGGVSMGTVEPGARPEAVIRGPKVS